MTQNGLIVAGAGLGYVGGQLWYGKALTKPTKMGIIVTLVGATVGYLYFKEQASQAQG